MDGAAESRKVIHVPNMFSMPTMFSCFVFDISYAIQTPQLYCWRHACWHRGAFSSHNLYHNVRIWTHLGPNTKSERWNFVWRERKFPKIVVLVLILILWFVLHHSVGRSSIFSRPSSSIHLDSGSNMALFHSPPLSISSQIYCYDFHLRSPLALSPHSVHFVECTRCWWFILFSSLYPFIVVSSTV